MTSCFLCYSSKVTEVVPWYDRPLWLDPRTGLLTAGIGGFEPGYVLLAPIKHEVNLRLAATLDDGHIFLEFITDVMIFLEDQFGHLTFWEHGSPVDHAPRSACIEHAHLHIVPGTLSLSDPPEATRFSTLVDALTAPRVPTTQGYLLLGWSGGHVLVGADIAISQYYRREWAQFGDLLENGAQAQGIPDGIYAAGQHLNPYSLNRRGLYGTAAALLVLSRSKPSAKRMDFIEGLIKYVNERPEIEESLAQTDEDRAWLTTRLLKEGRTAFKCAELLYALAAAPPAAVGREMLLRSLLDRLREGRRDSGGWAPDLDPKGDRDPLATASVMRALHAAGIAVTDEDSELVRRDAADAQSVSLYVRTFCVLVLLEVGRFRDDISKLWKILFDSLRSEFRDRTEANYEFRLGNKQEYVRVPWQLYLLSGAAICRPGSIVFESDVRRTLLDAIHAVGSNEGYIYPSFGHMKSTRTYSVLMDTLWRVQAEMNTAKYVSRVSTLANAGIRVLYSRSTAVVALAASIGLVGLAIYAWVAKVWTVGALAPEIVAAGLLGLISFLLGRVRARRLP